MSGYIYEVDVDYNTFTATEVKCSCGLGTVKAADESDPMFGPFTCTSCGATDNDGRLPLAAWLEVGTRIVVTLARFDSFTGSVIPWHITGKVAAPVNREGYTGTIPGVRLTDASCDDPQHDCTTHAIATTTQVRAILKGTN